MTEKEIVAFSDSRIIFSDKVIGVLFKKQPPLLFQFEARLTSKTQYVWSGLLIIIISSSISGLFIDQPLLVSHMTIRTSGQAAPSVSQRKVSLKN